MVCPSIASAVAGKLSLTVVHTSADLHTHTQTHVVRFGHAPLGGPRLKQEADVTAWRVNIGQVVCVCVWVSVCVSVLFSASLLSVSWDAPSTHPPLCICGLLDSIDQSLKA